MEAQEKLANVGKPLSLRHLLSRDRNERRDAMKRVAYRLPCRPSIVFLYLYVVRLGFLDGRAGLAFSCMRASYEIAIDVKSLELARRQRNLPV